MTTAQTIAVVVVGYFCVAIPIGSLLGMYLRGRR
jgi:hypothetical protein